MNERLSRRALLGVALGFTATGTGLALWGLTESAPPRPLHESTKTPEPTPTPQPEPIERARTDAYSISEESGVHLNQLEIDAIAAVLEKLSVFQPSTDITIDTIDPLWQVIGDHITFSDKLFENDYDSRNRQDIEIPYALFLSSITRVVSEANDGDKFQALGSFMDWFENAEIADLTEPEVLGRDIFNPYRNLYSHMASDVAEYDKRLSDPFHYFASVATAFYTNVGNIKNQIVAMPTETQYYPEYSQYGEDAGIAVVDSHERAKAKATVDRTYSLLKELSVGVGEKIGNGGKSDRVNQVFDGFNDMYFAIGLWEGNL